MIWRSSKVKNDTIRVTSAK